MPHQEIHGRPDPSDDDFFPVNDSSGWDNAGSLGDAETDQILAWLEQLESADSTSRKITIASQLSVALEGFMGIEREMLKTWVLDLAGRRS
jgi:hypothetical protein